ncbi:MAG: alpha/beta hydrolase [Candidatus Limnocylindrales bacterium]
MPTLERGAVSLYYEERGSGFPLLLFAPGGMHSRAAFWGERPEAWFDPRTELADEFRVIAMDQRNAGASRAPVSASDGWQTYVADALALLDHLGVTELAVMGGCIGVSFALRLCAEVPSRVRAAVLQNPIGASGDGHDHFGGMYEKWVDELRTGRSDVEPDALAGLRANLFSGEFVFSVTRDFVRTCNVPMLVLPGSDAFHPPATAEEIARLAPHAELVERWRPADIGREAMVALVRDFLWAHVSA